MKFVVHDVVPSCGVDQESKLASLRKLASQSVNNDPVIVVDLGDVNRKHQQWLRLLPRIEPFYAFKCNSDPAIGQALASLGTGFDCASLVEMETILGLGVDPSRIIYAHPCKVVA
jgi:ornithine decarboxylase